MKLFAAIYIGTYEISLRVYEISGDKKIKEIDCLRTRTDIAKDIYQYHKLTEDTERHLLRTLKEMKGTISMYGIKDYGVYGGYSLKTADNIMFVLDRVKQELSMDVEILSNSEHRFLSYQALTFEESFHKMEHSNMLIVDIGGYSIQLTLFSEGEMVTTQHILLGAVNVREYKKRLAARADYRKQINEMIYKELEGFSNMYLKGQSIEYLVLLNDQIYQNIYKYLDPKSGHFYEYPKYLDFVNRLNDKNFFTLMTKGEEIEDREEIFSPMLTLVQAVSNCFPAETVYFPGISINEGIAYEYAKNSKAISATHDFDEDVLQASWAIASRYGSYKPHLEMLLDLGGQIFTAVRKSSGLKKRDLLLYQVAAILHDCGKYISLSQAGQCSYTIIMSSEILGLSHKEREMVAYVALFHRNDILPYNQVANRFSKEEYLTILKLLAILRVANALDRSHKQKMKKVRMTLKGDVLNIKTSAKDSLSLEKGFFQGKADFFREVFSIRPVINESREM